MPEKLFLNGLVYMTLSDNSSIHRLCMKFVPKLLLCEEEELYFDFSRTLYSDYSFLVSLEYVDTTALQICLLVILNISQTEYAVPTTWFEK